MTTTKVPFLPQGKPCLNDTDIEAVVAVLKGDWLTNGPNVEAFEVALRQKFQAKHAVVCSNGTTALHLAAVTLGIRPGDVVIVPAITFLATANAIRYVGAEVVFSDVDPVTGLMTPDNLEDAIQKAKASGLNLRAVFPVHYAGQITNITHVARKHNLLIIEDSCHAIGTTYINADGSIGHVGDAKTCDMATFSFHPVKNITTGEGGAILTNNTDYATKLLTLRNQGMVREPARLQNKEQGFTTDGKVNPWYYEMSELGFNYRLTDIQSALGLSQLQRLDAIVARRRQLVNLYDSVIQHLSPSVQPLNRVTGCNPAWHLYIVLIDFESIGYSRAEVMTKLREKGIGSQVHYLPVYRQPYYQKRYGSQHLNGAEQFYAKALSLPLFETMNDEDVFRVVTALSDIIKS